MVLSAPQRLALRPPATAIRSAIKIGGRNRLHTLSVICYFRVRRHSVVAAMQINFLDIVARAWAHYDDSRAVQSVDDISVLVSTNHVFRVRLENGDMVIGKVSYFGRYESFVEDHTLINALANNLPTPFDQFLSRSLVKKNQLFIYRHQDELLDVWVVFYNPIAIDTQLPKQFQAHHIEVLGRELALFHRACTSLTNILPDWSKTLRRDMADLAAVVRSAGGPILLSRSHRRYPESNGVV